MRQAQGQLAVLTQGIETHDPGVRSAINAALIAYDQELFFGMKSLDSGEAAGDFGRLEWQEMQFEISGLAGEPVPAAPAERAFSIKQDVESLHSPVIAVCACGGMGGGAR